MSVSSRPRIKYTEDGLHDVFRPESSAIDRGAVDHVVKTAMHSPPHRDVLQGYTRRAAQSVQRAFGILLLQPPGTVGKEQKQFMDMLLQDPEVRRQMRR